MTTRTPTQVASHAQKYFIRQVSGGKDKRRSSIHDITVVNLPETKPPSSDSNTPLSPNHLVKVANPHQNQKLSSMVKQEYQYDWNLSDEGTFVFNSAKGNMFVAPLRGVSSYESKPQGHNLLRGTNHGCQFSPYDTVLQMHSMPMQHQ